ncbi:hypothetical protein GJ689_08265 [Rhodoplanes serenus]|uniref:Uncharacterized protein n=1 Tax=Rhodoplanes serenus TaxID=200615 RepID=A0A9X5ARH6_9BRAD|nr:hypothetical protein [Rhodoplanes serenus]MTW16201.1 hypothetical protein [Rhodoplanes serenus]
MTCSITARSMATRSTMPAAVLGTAMLAAVVLTVALPAPAKAQMAGFGQDQMMTQMAPMMEMMKQRMGKRRYAQLMQTFGPMMANMMDSGGGGFGGLGGGGFGTTSFGGMGGGMGMGGMGMGGMGMGGMDMGSMMGMMSAIDWRSMQGLMGSSRRARKTARR